MYFANHNLDTFAASVKNWKNNKGDGESLIKKSSKIQGSKNSGLKKRSSNLSTDYADYTDF